MNPIDSEAAGLTRRLGEVLAAGHAPNLHGLAVMRRGHLILEHYGVGRDHAWGTDLGIVAFDRRTLHDLRSVTKSVTALLYGIALERDSVPAPHEPLLRHFPEYPDLASDPQRQALRVEHALTMTLGLDWNERVPYTSTANSEIAMEAAPDRYRYVLERPIVEPPGQHWLYCGGASALLGRLIVKGTQKPLPEFANEVLFDPLGIDAFEWLAGGDGVHSPASGLRLGLRDLVRIGELVLARGDCRGHQVLTSDSLDAMLTARVALGDGLDYGYQWYLGSLAGSASWRFAAGQATAISD